MTRSLLHNASVVRDVLVRAGLPEQAASAKTALFSRCADVLGAENGTVDFRAFFVPGRIEVLGKHTDYAGGDSLLCAVSHGFCFVAAATDEEALTVIHAGSGERVTLSSGTMEPESGRVGHWSNYPATVWRRLQNNAGKRLNGGLVAFDSDLPASSGISSSSALVVGTFLAVDALNDLRDSSQFKQFVPTVEALGDYLGCVENGRDYPGMPGTAGVGTTGGSQDQTAILCARPGELQHFSFAPTTYHESVAMPEGFVFGVASSGVVAEKTGSALQQYNRVGSRAAEVVRIWNSERGNAMTTLGQIARRDGFDAEDLRTLLEKASGADAGASLVGRFDQFYRESLEIIPAAVDALRSGSLDEFALAVQQSQELAELHLENQVPETIALVQIALEEGAVAASAFGAGFGGSVWAMVDESSSGEFLSRWASRYRLLFPVPAQGSRFFVERPGPGAFELDLPK